MDAVLNPTLQHITFTKIAITLWNHSWPKLGLSPHETEALVLNKMDHLPLHGPLIKELSAFIPPIALQIVKWCCHLHNHYGITERNPRKICWTPEGTIHARKSVEMLLKDQSLGLKTRYQLACNFCFVDQIETLYAQIIIEEPNIWKYLARERTTRPRLNNEHLGFHNALRFDSTGIVRHQTRMLFVDMDLVKFWSRRLRGETWIHWAVIHPSNRDLSFNQHGLKLAVFSHNPVATKYFFERLNFEERQWAFSLVRQQFDYMSLSSGDKGLPEQFLNETLRFLLSRMSEDQRKEILKECDKGVWSECFSVWPYQSLLLETLNGMWDVISEADFSCILYTIFGRIAYEHEACFYRDLFRDFWRSSPEKYKGFLFDPQRCHHFRLYGFFEKGEKDICKMMLSDADDRERDLLLYNDNVIDLYRTEILENREMFVAYVTFFLVECGSFEKCQKLFRYYGLNMNDYEEMRKYFVSSNL